MSPDNGRFRLFSKCAWTDFTFFVSIRTNTYSVKVKITWIFVLNLELSVFETRMRNCQTLTVPRQPFTYHLKDITLWYMIYIYIYIYIYRNDTLLEVVPSGWKGSVTYGLGADISLPHCLATGIWSLVLKATSGSKTRGTSFGTTLWHHVQRYCTQFPCFMQIMCLEYSFSHGRTNLFNSTDKLKNVNIGFIFRTFFHKNNLYVIQLWSLWSYVFGTTRFSSTYRTLLTILLHTTRFSSTYRTL